MKDAVLIVLKFVMAVLMLPLVIGSTMALQTQIESFDAGFQHCVWAGMMTYLILFFFVYDFSHVYSAGQGVVTFCFQFLKPLVNAASFVIPIYTFFVLLVYGLLGALGQLAPWKNLLFTLISATFTMHIILTAQSLYKKDTVAGKPTYFFGMSLVYIVDVFLIALAMNAVLKGFSFTHFFQTLSNVSFDIYRSVLSQLFGM